MSKFGTGLVLFFTFAVWFLMTTMVFDVVCQSIGYYNEGLEASASFNE